MEIPGGLVVRIPGFHSCSLSSNPDGGAEPCSAEKKQKKKEKKSELGVWRDKWVQEKGKLSNIISDIQGTRK